MNNDFNLNRARAIRELQLQQGFAVSDAGRALGRVFPVEFLDEQSWTTMRAQKPMLLISPARAAVLGAIAERGALGLSTDNLSLTQIWDLVACSKASAANAPRAQAPDFSGALIGLAKEAGIIPALLWFPETKDEKDFVLSREALLHHEPARIIGYQTVSLPIEGAEDSTITSFRTQNGAGVHLALTVGKIGKDQAPLVRVHSSCVTGDMLGSMRCDCGNQLRAAFERMKEDSGILLYLYQEGRGIGITSKLRAYALQQQGIDTFAANEQLGFEEDERDFSIASEILKSLGYRKIRLLTNNPDKIKSFADSGIEVVERVPLVVGKSKHNEAYFEAKRVKRGHQH